MAWQKILIISILVEAFLIFRNIAAHQCRINSYSVYQMMLKDHAYKTFKAPPGSLDCRQACNSDVRCQSFNYVMLEHICELNDRTKEAQPEDFVKNSERYYVTKVPNRVPLGSIPDVPADTCGEIKASEGGQAVSGNYWLDPARSGNSILAYCDMRTLTADFCFRDRCLNHATCVNWNVSYSCVCKPGWTGIHCEQDIDECSEGLHECDSKATCQNTEGSYNCTCKAGYVGDGVNCEPEECQNYQIVADARRITTNGFGYLCDDSLGPDWFRFHGNVGTRMPTSCVPHKTCGTSRPGWLKGGHPKVEEGKVTRKVCFRNPRGCCQLFKYITVRNCGSFYVYYLNGIPSVYPEAYCGEAD